MSQQPLEFTVPELEAIRKEYCSDATDTQFTLFIEECKRRLLVPGRHVIFQTRSTQEYDPDLKAKKWVKKPVYITTISALRLIAQRTGEYLGQGREKYIYLDDQGKPTIESPIPLPDAKGKPRIPWVAEATVFRKEFTEPMVGVARWDAYAQYAKAEGSGERYLTSTWATRGSEQLSKCAEALALRKAYPEDTANLYLTEELKAEDDEQPIAPSQIVPQVQVQTPPPVPKVDQTPTQPAENKETIDAKPAEKTDKIPAKKGRPRKSTSVDASTSETPKEDIKADLPSSREFVSEATEFTPTQAAEAGLPPPPDPMPEPEEFKNFQNQVRTFVGNGITTSHIGKYVMGLAKKEGMQSKYLTKREWETALRNMETAKLEGKLAELLGVTTPKLNDPF